MKDKITSYIKHHIYFLIAIGLVIIIFIVFISFIPIAPDFNLNKATFDFGLRSPRLLDGQMVHKKRTDLKPIAIIMENHVDSRPISGLDQASIVYEVIVEGDITRFFAIFDGGFNSKKIGPIRSVRPFFVDIAEEWDPVLFHAGGSTNGLQQLRFSQVYNINEISKDGIYFWRDGKRDQPHNLYISSDQVNRALLAKGIEDQSGDFTPWLFKDDQLAHDMTSGDNLADQTSATADFEVIFSGNPFYDVQYKYNPDSNDYTRVINNKTHKTDKGIVLKAKNVVVQYVDAKILDSYGRLSIKLKGKGEALIYQDGRKIDGTWEKKISRTRFYDFEGEEIKFNRGTIWIELVFN